MSASALALRDTISRLARDNAALVAALKDSTRALQEAREEIAILRTPFFRRWRMRRLLRKRGLYAVERADAAPVT